jgi:hypothetical protein
MPPPKKVPFTPFKTRARCRSVDPPGQVKEDEAGQGEFRETAVTFAPAIPKADVSLTIQWRCTVCLVRGDVVTIRLGGFKGAQASLFCLEARPHPENRDFRDAFHAYWSGETPPKGGPPAQSIILQVRKTIEQNAFVVVGVPDSVHLALPEKLGANSAKLKIEGVVKHSNGPGPNGKIPKAPVAMCPEVKKKQMDDDLTELETQVKLIADDPQIQLDEDEIQIALDTTQQEADHMWEAAREVSELKLGLPFRIETSAWTEYKAFAPLCEMITDSFRAASKKRNPLALHREIAKNLEVKVGLIIMLEDVLYMLHGSQYSELSRAAILVLRLWTMEPGDICRVLGVVQAPSIQRDILSAMRTFSQEVIAKWALTIGTLMTCTSKLTHIMPEMIPPLFRGVKDLPPEALQRIATLKKGTVYAFPAFTHLIAEPKYNEENFSAPDSAVVFEVRDVVEGVEIGDISQYPESREWMLPMFTSFDVVSVEQLAEKNNMLHVVLHVRGSLGGAMREDTFSESDRSLYQAVAKTAKNSAALMATHSQAIARLVYANVRLNDMKAIHPAHVMHSQYLDKFADVKRASQAKLQVEEGLVRWQQSTDGYVAGGEPVNLRLLSWENLNKKQAANIEALFLKRTRSMKQFTIEGCTCDFKEWIADFGKGMRRVRRVVGKSVTHPYIS